MTTALTTRQNNLPAFNMDERELMAVLQSSLYPGASEPSIKLVLNYCRASGLDPMQKPVHIVPMWDKNTRAMRDVIMPGVGLYRTNAARTNELAGISEPEFGPTISFEGVNVPEWCRITVKRLIQGAERSFTALEYWVENYATAGKDSTAPNTMWRKRPRGQLAKCAQAQALRMAFPEATGSQPTADEMEGKSIETIDATTGEIIPQKPAAPVEYSAEEFGEKFAGWEKTILEGKPADRVIAFTESRSGKRFTEEQRAKLMAVNPKAKENVQDVPPKGEQSIEQFLAEFGEGN